MNPELRSLMRYEPGAAVLRPVMVPDWYTAEDADAGKDDLADHDKTADRRFEVSSIYDSVSTGLPLGIRNQGACGSDSDVDEIDDLEMTGNTYASGRKKDRLCGASTTGLLKLLA
ncbi:hypothetical protein N7499_006799 [Penicillium canescens]|uniref:Uncharacterized protein n=1 Tax=Penicillium canescens TaxID=5083 RepID=A0AAD6N9H9_PENCN|nr:uncharacterized protein N7446_002489 [Penicillium canescens]KAJ5996889.1 hypothetical protein N7522_008549 [Penicillium canescens]KAJ6044293.1 hypothetical protein N7460_005648 [Penicillium canescens]KAJ6055762.1 hypothetical protein N7444_004860 [Penicillium canescens]KAJ6074712.1 hypothetical protein N7446_002489 [Penicillium canescens]KAJ6081925.1 hypothetical protein N7499_006799 [Penicillium canescens]